MGSVVTSKKTCNSHIFKHICIFAYWTYNSHINMHKCIHLEALSEATKDDGTCLGLDRGPPELESSGVFFKAEWHQPHGSKLHSN